MEGNWSLHTKEFAANGLWGYMNLLDANDVLETERELLQLAFEDGPYDGILGYSQGATLAAQAIVRHAKENPTASINELPFRFAIFFNAATPVHCFKLTEKATPIIPDPEDPLIANFKHTMKANPLLHTTTLRPAALPSGRSVLTDGKLALKKLDVSLDGVVIKIPTLHVMCASDAREHGEENYQLCEPELAQRYFHSHKHDFPRGYDEMRNIARMIRSTAERAM